MNTRFLSRIVVSSTVFGLLGAISLIGSGRPVYAAPVAPFTDRFLGAVASFASFDSTGCVVTGAGVIFGQDVTQLPPGPPTAAQDVHVEVFRFDTCTNTGFDVFSVSFTGTIQVDEKLNTGTVIGAATMSPSEGGPGSTFPVAVNLSFQGVGPISEGTQTMHIRSPNCMTNLRMTGDSRAAQVSGSISDGTIDFVTAPQFASLISTTFHSVSIGTQCGG